RTPHHPTPPSLPHPTLFRSVPPYLQNRRETRPGDSIASFRSQLSVLERTTPGGRAGSITRLDVARHDPHHGPARRPAPSAAAMRDRKSTRLNSSHVKLSYAV